MPGRAWAFTPCTWPASPFCWLEQSGWTVTDGWSQGLGWVAGAVPLAARDAPPIFPARWPGSLPHSKSRSGETTVVMAAKRTPSTASKDRELVLAGLRPPKTPICSGLSISVPNAWCTLCRIRGCRQPPVKKVASPHERTVKTLSYTHLLL